MCIGETRAEATSPLIKRLHFISMLCGALCLSGCTSNLCLSNAPQRMITTDPGYAIVLGKPQLEVSGYTAESDGDKSFTAWALTDIRVIRSSIGEIPPALKFVSTDFFGTHTGHLENHVQAVLFLEPRTSELPRKYSDAAYQLVWVGGCWAEEAR